jgi:hypothetical protein
MKNPHQGENVFNMCNNNVGDAFHDANFFVE